MKDKYYLLKLETPTLYGNLTHLLYCINYDSVLFYHRKKATWKPSLNFLSSRQLEMSLDTTEITEAEANAYINDPSKYKIQ